MSVPTNKSEPSAENESDRTLVVPFASVSVELRVPFDTFQSSRTPEVL